VEPIEIDRRGDLHCEERRDSRGRREGCGRTGADDHERPRGPRETERDSDGGRTWLQKARASGGGGCEERS
jgi:hypothetical protein